MLRFTIILLVTFAGMEAFSYLVHRFAYHKLLWVLHKSHHSPRAGWFEWNDIFPLVFACVAIVMIIGGLSEGGPNDLLAASLGVTMYGMVYFVVHDLYVHRRVKSLKLRIPFLLRIKKAHAVHHRYNGEPYGLLITYIPKRVGHIQIGEEEAV